MSDLRFEWDARKSAANERRHGVAFEEASSVFLDENGLLLDDPDHSANEDRFILIGMSTRLRLLVVVHCVREDDTILRIISARRPTRREREEYITRWKP